MLTDVLFPLSFLEKICCRVIMCSALAAALLLCGAQQSVFAQDSSVSEQAQIIAAQYGVDALVVQQMLNSGIPADVIDGEMIQEYSLPEANGSIPLTEAPPAPAIAPMQTLTQEVVLESCSSQNFPFIFINVGVRDNGSPILDLPASSFQCAENGIPQTDLFSVTPPQAGGNVRLADIVFLIDASGSMDDEIVAVRQNVSAFAQSLGTSGVDFRLGLVQFGNQTGANPMVFNGGNLTDDVAAFTSLIDTLRATGGYEPGFLALRMAVQEFSFRPGAQKVFLLISDEDSDDRNKQATIDLLKANDVTVHTAVDCGFGSSRADYCDDTSVRGVTGGGQFARVGPYDQILDAISARTASTYVLGYRSSNPAYNGAARTVTCSVATATATNSVTCVYTPGAEPRIERTQATVELTKTSLAEGTTPAIAVRVTDVVTPGVKSVTLYYRTTNSGAGYKSLAMRLSGSDLYSAVLPPVSQPGVDYYIRATDGQLTSQSPATDPGLHPHQIGVLPNYRPALSHQALAIAPTDVDINLSVFAADSTNRLVTVSLKWKYVNELIYRTVPMIPGADNQFTATIAKAQVVRDINYYIVATDDLSLSNSSGSADYPHTIRVADYSGTAISVTMSKIVHFDEQARVTVLVTRNGKNESAKVGLEVLSGPNIGDAKNNFCITVVGWNGPCITDFSGAIVWKYKYDGRKGIGKDEVRAYVDVDRNNRYDNGEPFVVDTVGWYEHISYAALGDSYSSGEGLGGYINDTDKDGNRCHQSKHAFSQILAPYPYDKKLSDVKGPKVDFLACSGAKTGHILGNVSDLKLSDTEDDKDATNSGPSEKVNDGKVQHASLAEKERERGIEMVTISVGGNDTEWPRIIEFCLFQDNCGETVFRENKLTREWINDRIKVVLSRVEVTVKALKQTAPNSALLVLGYPLMFPGDAAQQTCPELANPIKTIFREGDNFSAAEQDLIRKATNELDDGLAQLASRLGVHFVDPRKAFEGHEICGTKKEDYVAQLDLNWAKWDKGQPVARDFALHPNQKGHEAYQDVIEEYIKQQIDHQLKAGASLNRAGLPLGPSSSLVSIPNHAPVIGPSAEQVTAVDSVQYTTLAAEQTDLLCGTVYGSLGGGTVRVSKTGFMPGTPITLTLQVLGMNDISLAPAVADANGSFEATIVLPAVTYNTAFSVMAVGVASDDMTVVASTGLLQLFAQLPPCPADDIIATQLETPVRIDVLANDNAGAVALDPATLVVRVQPDGGTARVDVATRSLVYAPDLGFFGEDSITYGVCDLSGTCAEGLVSITVSAGCTINGTDDADTLVGTAAADVICGYGGDDIIDGGDGNDVILGGSGHDALYGGPGDDRVFGDTGENVASGGDGVDLVVPGGDALLSDVSEIRTPQKINSLLVLTSTASVHDAAAAPNAPYGTYSLTATFTNLSAQPISNPFFDVTTLSENNVLLNADAGASGEGGRRSVPLPNLGENGILDPGETFTVDFSIGIVSQSVFNFAIDAYGVVEGEGRDLVSGEAEGFRFGIGEENLHFVRPLYLPVISR